MGGYPLEKDHSTNSGKRFSVIAIGTISCMLLLLCVLCIFGTHTVSAEQAGDYSYSVDDNQATITGYTGAGGAVSIPSTLGGHATVAIGDRAFASSSVTSVTIPASVKSIGNYAFADCLSLNAVDIPYGVKTIGNYGFDNCQSLTVVKIPYGVYSIGDYAFANCLSLVSINIPESVSSIGIGPFESCHSLVSINVDPCNFAYASVDGVLYNKSITTLIECPGGKAGAFSIPDSVTSIADRAFINCLSITSVTIPNGVQTIGELAFANCQTLTSVTIPGSVTDIGSRAFNSCPELASVILPDGLTSMGSEAFSYCTSLISVTVPESVTSIGYGAFMNCTGLTSINVDPGNTVYASIDGVLYNKEITSLIQCPAGKGGAFDIPEGVTSIGGIAFYSCTGITSLAIPDSLVTIGNDAFGNCQSLTGVTIPDNVTSIGGAGFASCTSLTSVSMGRGVTTIGYNAFKDCTSLVSISFFGSMAPTSVETDGSWNWILGTSATLRGHAYADSNFPAPGGVWNGLVMGDVIPRTGNDEYAYTVEGNSATITGYTGPGGNINIPESLGGYPVQAIGNGAFRSCTGLTSVTIPGSVLIIEANAFDSCTSLRSVTIPWCVESIQDEAFGHCTALMSINFIGAAGPTCVGTNWLEGTLPELRGHAYANSDFPAPGEKWNGLVMGQAIPDLVEGDYKYIMSCDGAIITGYTGTGGDIIIPNELGGYFVSEIDQYAFRSCNTLTSVTVPGSLGTIEGYAFDSCVHLRSFTLSGDATIIGSHAFASCPSLEYVTISGGLTLIEANAFDSCTYLDIPGSINTIESYAFASCGSLAYFNLSGSVTFIESYAFDRCDHVNISGSVTVIDDNAFFGSASLTSVSIPGMVNGIDAYAFASCPRLKSVNISGMVNEIGEHAFFDCASLKSVNISGSINSIDGYAFASCPSLKSVSITGWVSSMASTAFDPATVVNYPAEGFASNSESTLMSPYSDPTSLPGPTATVGTGSELLGTYRKE
jgi:hypothetical protein